MGHIRLRFTWSGQRDSNPRSQPWQGRALPTKLCPQTSRHISFIFKQLQVEESNKILFLLFGYIVAFLRSVVSCKIICY